MDGCRHETREEGKLVGALPSQPAAGKLEYYIKLGTPSGREVAIAGEKPVVIRFKGNVPAGIMIPHILIMFFAMLLSNLAGLTAAFKSPRQKIYGQWALWLLLAGGMILGPLVQKYAFGDLWTGIPFGWDLTDNKTLIAVIAWIFAVVMNRKKGPSCLHNRGSSHPAPRLFYSSQHVRVGTGLRNRDRNSGLKIFFVLIQLFFNLDAALANCPRHCYE